MQEETADKDLAQCWQIAAFTGAAFGGKLKKLSHYTKDRVKSNAPTISKNEFERKLAEAERVKANGS